MSAKRQNSATVFVVLCLGNSTGEGGGGGGGCSLAAITRHR